MGNDAFCGYHPIVNFMFFLGVIGFGATIQHPAYCAAGFVCAMLYFFLLNGRRGVRSLGMVGIFFLVLTFINPLINKSGKHVLFTWLGRPYTLEALCYGAVLGCIMAVMLLWFGCYSAVLTSDKFTALFGNLIPSLSLLLVMVLRMIPAFTRKAKQILLARRAIGKGIASGQARAEQFREGAAVLSSLTDWALEGSLNTADSMRARGYGSGKRTQFRRYSMTKRDWALLALILGLELAVMSAGGTDADYIPKLKISPIGWGFPVYCVFLLIPSILHIQEATAWRWSQSRI